MSLNNTNTSPPLSPKSNGGDISPKFSSSCPSCVSLSSQNKKLVQELESLHAMIAILRNEPRSGITNSSVIDTKLELNDDGRMLDHVQSLHHSHETSILPDGSMVQIAPEEVAAMRSLFAVFDSDHDGAIGVEDLRALHHKLGEPITEEEALDAIDTIGMRGSISFEAFVQYWDGSHPSLQKILDTPSTGTAVGLLKEKKKATYQAKFKFLRAKLPNPAVARVFTDAKGTDPSLEFRLCFNYDAGEPFGRVDISPWHDVPLHNTDGTFNMIVEVPKWSRRKYEMATGELFNPIKIDVKNGKLREYAWGDSLFNYGAFPQTWEDPKHISPETNCGGDNDPLDVYDLGTRCWKVGEIVRVKVLGVVGLIDAGETDWKILAVSAEDPLAPLLNDIDDVNVHIPGAIAALMKWLKFYKAPIINDFAFEGEPKGRVFAEKVIKDTHLSWQALMTEKEGGDSVTAMSNAPSIVSAGLRRSTSADKLSSLVFQ